MVIIEHERIFKDSFTYISVVSVTSVAIKFWMK